MISIRRSCHGLYISDGVHPLGSPGTLPCPAAGLLLDVLGLSTVFSENRYSLFRVVLSVHDRLRQFEVRYLRKTMRKRAQRARAYSGINDEYCAFRARPCNAPRPSA